jgi:hypothetical protein
MMIDIKDICRSYASHERLNIVENGFDGPQNFSINIVSADLVTINYIK